MNKNTNRFSEEHRQADSIVRIEKQTSSNTQSSVGVQRILNFLELTVGKEIEKTFREGNLMRCIKNLKRLDTITKACHFQEGILNKQVQKS